MLMLTARNASFAALSISMLLAGSALARPQEPKTEEKPASELGALEFRSLGPAISGRATSATGVLGQPLVFYAGFAQGGVWKSTDGGRQWKPIFDDQPTQAIGSIAVAPSDPNVIYVGSGEANIRGNVSFGSGLFRSTDAGKTWQHVWKTRGQIGSLAIHPQDANVAYAAVLGSPFGPGEERGIYRTRDGGTTWQRVLFVDAETGASEVTLDPTNPRIVFAGMWQTRREPWKLTSGGKGSGLHRSSDGGETWTKLEGSGLPSGSWGKVGVRVAPSKPEVVYALIEAEEGGLFRSDDGGKSWERRSAARVLRQRAWYYTVITIDPTNPDIVWFPQVNLLRTIDGGKAIHSVETKIHGDHHELWIDPVDPRRKIVANDGGVGVTLDGEHWFSPPLPTGQFYNIDVDDRSPYHVGGTMQDWGTASGPAYTLRGGESSGPSLADFFVVGGGEAGDFLYDRSEPGHIYAGEYSGYLSHHDERARQTRSISVHPRNYSGIPAERSRDRIQWTAPLAASPHHPQRLYHASQRLFASDDRGASWRALSEDLTRNDRTKQQWSGGPITGDLTGVEVYGTIFSIAESTHRAGEIWVGTDDGLVQLTRDGGATWTNVTPKDLPEWGTVESIELSRAHAGTAYVVVDARRLDDPRPHLFRTRDHGQNWERLQNGLPADQHLFVVREDPTDPELLYVGAERGLFFSRDAGASFVDLRGNLPAVGVADLEVKHDDLILGTRRGLWILDDLSALRRLTAAAKAEPAVLFPPRPATRVRLASRWDRLESTAASNRPHGLVIHYWLKEAVADPAPGAPRSQDDPSELRLEILDAQGQLVRTLSSVPRPNRYAPDDADDPEEPNKGALTRKQGLQRVVWDLRHEGAKRLHAKIDAGNPDRGPLVLPGRYRLRLRLRVGERLLETEAEILPDPSSPATQADLEQNLRTSLELRAALDRITDLVEELRSIRSQVEAILKPLGNDDATKAVREAGSELIARCNALEARLHNPEAEVVYDVLSGRAGGAKLYSQISPLLSELQSSDHAPTQGLLEQKAENEGELEAIGREVDGFRSGELARFEAEVRSLPRVLLPRRKD
ncbi:MAG: glycosyl hydrolase [Planctomycetes bacterium]|nr:glycosyl hydrolase [Planctomycetota bacterium]